MWPYKDTSFLSKVPLPSNDVVWYLETTIVPPIPDPRRYICSLLRRNSPNSQSELTRGSSMSEEICQRQEDCFWGRRYCTNSKAAILDSKAIKEVGLQTDTPIHSQYGHLSECLQFRLTACELNAQRLSCLLWQPIQIYYHSNVHRTNPAKTVIAEQLNNHGSDWQGCTSKWFPASNQPWYGTFSAAGRLEEAGHGNCPNRAPDITLLSGFSKGLGKKQTQNQ